MADLEKVKALPKTVEERLAILETKMAFISAISTASFVTGLSVAVMLVGIVISKLGL